MSTSIPAASDSPPSDIRLMFTSKRCMKAKVETMLMGIERLTTKGLRQSRRKKNSTRNASPAPQSSESVRPRKLSCT